MQPIGLGRRNFGKFLATGQSTQYSSELDDGYYRKGIVKSYTILTTGLFSGTSNIDLAHLNRTDISFDNATKEIRCTGQCGVFKVAGGETIVVSGAAQAGNNGVWTTASATADKIVLTTSPTTEGAGANITIAKREAISNNCVIDNNTGLMWLRTNSVKMGIAGDGKMPWTGVNYDIFAFCAACNAAGLGGYSDWRIPNNIEALNLRNIQAATAVPDTTAFPSWPANLLWTSTTVSNASSSAFYVNYATGVSSNSTKGTALWVALVRG